MTDADLLERARRWRDEDPDPVTRAEVDALLDAGDEPGLADRFGSRLAFGTAGLRGAMGAGPNRMNLATVRYAAAGVARWVGPGTRVVIGFDARRRSADFASDSARVLAAAGVDAFVLPEPLPTPVLAFAVRHLGCDAGIMVTASHNPASDNGYKVYAGDGAQIVAPADAEIASAIDGFDSLAAVELAPADDPRLHRLDREVVERYLDGAVAAAPGGARDVTAVYTPLHGVGLGTFLALLERAGFPAPHVVAAQARPDADFPTVAFPNPEEPGALDLAFALADDVGADVVVANDPDADRLAVAVPAGHGGGTAWRRLSGDELGVLLADQLLSGTGSVDGRRPLVATTVVSSRMLRSVADAHDAAYAETLTGFKWLVRPALAHPELRPVLAYEEALGYAVGELVRDKDGLTAGLAALAMAAEAKAAGSSLSMRLEELFARHGVHVTGQVSLRDEAPGGLARIGAAVAAVRAGPPSSVAGRDVVRVRDLLVEHDPPPGSVGGPLPPTDAVVLELAGGARAVVRPSGTEPKLKIYGEAVAADRAAAEAALAAVLDDLRRRLDGGRLAR